MSQHAKSVIAAFAAVVFVAITAWQQVASGGPFRWVDLIPVAVVVVGAIQTRVIPNVPELPWAKSVVAGSAAVLSAVATLVATDPAGVTAGKLLTVAAAAFLVWFVPEFNMAQAPLSDDGAHLATDVPQSPAPSPAAAAPFDRDELQEWVRRLQDPEEPPAAALPAPLSAEPPTAPMAAVAGPAAAV